MSMVARRPPSFLESLCLWRSLGCTGLRLLRYGIRSPPLLSPFRQTTCFILACVFRHWIHLRSLTRSNEAGGRRARFISLAWVARRLRSRRTRYQSVWRSMKDFRRSSAADHERPDIERRGSATSWATLLQDALSDSAMSSIRLVNSCPVFDGVFSKRIARKKCQRPWFGLTLMPR